MQRFAILLCLFAVTWSWDGLGVNVDPTNRKGSPALAELSALGATWVRVEFKDLHVGQPISKSFDFYDNYLSTIPGRRQSVAHSGLHDRHESPVIDRSDGLGDVIFSATHSGRAQLLRRYIESLSERAGEIAGFFGAKISAYEIWNEPDDKNTFVPAASFALMIKQVTAAIKNVSDATVVVGGLDTGNPGYVSDFLKANGGKLYADAVGLHPYGQRPDPNWPNPTWGFGYIATLLESYFTVESAPIWITEYGTSDASAQAYFPYHAYERISTNFTTRVPVLFWFCWSDGMVSPFGLVDINGKTKPSYNSYQQFAKSLQARWE